MGFFTLFLKEERQVGVRFRFCRATAVTGFRTQSHVDNYLASEPQVMYIMVSLPVSSGPKTTNNNHVHVYDSNEIEKIARYALKLQTT